MKKDAGGDQCFPLARRELEFMSVVWDMGEASALQVQDTLATNGRKLRESTVRTILRVLEEKGFLKHRIVGRTYLYAPRMERTQARLMAIQDMANRLFGGSLVNLEKFIRKEGKTAAGRKAGGGGARKK